VSESVERAVEVLEKLQPADAKYLFTTLVATQGWRGSDRSMTNECTNTNFNELVDWINAYCAAHTRADSIPLVRRQRWRLSSSQFRRTLAWFIARQYGGTIAGTIQYRHHSIQMFEGYAGTSESGFRGEVEAEQTLQRGERLLAMIENHEHHDLRGPAAHEAQTRLNNLQRSRAYTGSVVTDRRRLLRIIHREDPHIYLGHFVTCVYNPDKALCRRQLTTDGDQTMPDLASCQPLQCRNVALTSENVKALTTQLHKLDTHLAEAHVLAPTLPTASPSSAPILPPYSTPPRLQRTPCDRTRTTWRRRCPSRCRRTAHPAPRGRHLPQRVGLGQGIRHQPAPLSIGTTPRSPPRCLTAPHTNHAEGSKQRRPRRQDDDRDKTIRRLRSENNDLRRHLEIYEVHIRMLTIENTTYRAQLERLAGVTDLNTRRNP